MTAKLQIYKDSLELVKILYRAMPEMPRKDRFQIGTDIMGRSYELLDYIVLANQTRVKTERKKLLQSVSDYWWEYFNVSDNYTKVILKKTIQKNRNGKT